MRVRAGARGPGIAPLQRVLILVSNSLAIVKMLGGVAAENRRSFLIAWCMLLVATIAGLAINAQLRARIGELSRRARQLARARRDT